MLTEIDFSVYLICIIIGVIAAASYAFYNKSILGGFVKRLIEEGCDSEENGLSLRELGYDKSGLVRFALRPESSLSRVVKRYAPAEAGASANGAVRVNGRRVSDTMLDKSVFFIEEGSLEKAERTYVSHGTTVFSLVLTAIVFLFVMAASYFLIPLVTDIGNTMMNGFMENGENTLVKITGSEDYDFSDVIEADRLEQEKEANRKK